MIVDLLVSKGAFVNIACENTKCTPLHHSVKIGSVTATRILIDKDAKIESEEINGETPLHIAASVGNIDVLNILLMKCSKNLINYPDKVSILKFCSLVYRLFLVVRKSTLEYLRNIQLCFFNR